MVLIEMISDGTTFHDGKTMTVDRNVVELKLMNDFR